jgi:tetratricopeptide (TPR) repeat protein/tRNA A-37 threonylcarbamoyl transferase component Bud32
MPPTPDPNPFSPLSQQATEEINTPSTGGAPGEIPTLSGPISSAPADEEVPAQVGRYRVEKKIARGGMGVVLRAHDEVFHRTLAVKVLLDKPAQRPDLARRFLEEAQVMAQLQHPGIPPVHDLGTLPDGRPYFVMKLIHGRTLDELLKERPTPAHDLPRFLSIFGQLCQTLAFAHSRGILHRDLKPANVMVGPFGEVQVMDWGLAKVRGSKEFAAGDRSMELLSLPITLPAECTDTLTQKGTILGTPAFMAPEQAGGDAEQVDERSDVFGLGAVLCVVLTGLPPFTGATSAEMLAQAKKGALQGAYQRLDACGADAALVALAKRCLAADPNQRPRQAAEIVEAVAVYQIQVEERLRRTEIERAQAQIKAREERKRRRLTLTLAAALLLLITGSSAALVWYQNDQAAREQERTLQLAQRDRERTIRLAQLELGVRQALQEATTLSQRARTLVNNSPSWEGTLAAARTAFQQAQTLLGREPDLDHGSLAAAVEQVKVGLEADERDRRLLAVFDKVREDQGQMDTEGKRLSMAEAYPRLAKALTDYGLEIGKVSPENAATLLRQRPEALLPRLTAVLQECRYRAPAKAARERDWLTEVLSRADGDPWRQKVRQAEAAQQWTTLEELAGGVDVTRQHPAFLVWLARVLPAKARPTRLQLLRRTQQQYPEDFWVNFELAWTLYNSASPTWRMGTQREEDIALLDESIQFYRAAAALLPSCAAVHNNLGIALRNRKNVEGAIFCFRKALERNPRYTLAYNNLGIALQDKKELDEALACYKKALELDPNYASAHNNLGTALQDKKDLDGAIAHYKKALELDPRYVLARSNLGIVLQGKKDLDGAIACFQKAVELDPQFARCHDRLGLALYTKKELDAALPHFRKAIEIVPKSSLYHYHLGNALKEKQDLEGAIACYRKAIELNPNYVQAHHSLAIALRRNEKLEEAIVHYKKTLELDPKHTKAWYNLGIALRARGDLEAAITHYKKALELDPKYTLAHNNLANALRDKGDLEGASTHYQKAVEFNPKLPKAHNSLGIVLRKQGKFAESLAAFRRWEELADSSALKDQAATQVRLAEQLIELHGKLPRLLAGEEEPEDADECLLLGRWVCPSKKLYVAGVRFYREAFTKQPKLAEDFHAWHRYNAACCAALAGCGQGKDADTLDEKKRAGLRQEALDWLRADLALWSKLLDSGKPADRAEVKSRMAWWRKDRDFAGVRGAAALAKLPETERKAWRQFWDDVATTFHKASASLDP